MLTAPRTTAMLLGTAFLAAASAASAEPSPTDLVDALNAVFGDHPGLRAAHPKGVCVTGSFTPADGAAALSKAPQFAEPVSLTGRFSMAGGNPKAPDNAKGNARGLALRFNLPGGANMDLVMISAPVFAVKTPQGFFDLLMARASGDPAKVKAFFEANPDSRHQGQWLNARPVPASYAGVNYWGVHTFTLTDADGTETLVKFKAAPSNGEEGLTDAEAEAKGGDFLIGELKDRLAGAPAKFELMAIVGEDGDPTDDPTAFWDEEARKHVSLGTVSLDAIAPDATCDAFSFLPGNLTDGVTGPAMDPVFAVRTPAYAVSFGRRLAR